MPSALFPLLDSVLTWAPYAKSIWTISGWPPYDAACRRVAQFRDTAFVDIVRFDFVSTYNPCPRLQLARRSLIHLSCLLCPSVRQRSSVRLSVCLFLCHIISVDVCAFVDQVCNTCGGTRFTSIIERRFKTDGILVAK